MIRHRKGFESTIAYYELPDDKYNSLIDLLSSNFPLHTIVFLEFKRVSIKVVDAKEKLLIILSL